jgi:hypothetical protein
VVCVRLNVLNPQIHLNCENRNKQQRSEGIINKAKNKRKLFYHIEKQQQQDKCKEKWDTHTTCHKKKENTNTRKKALTNKRTIVFFFFIHGKKRD